MTSRVLTLLALWALVVQGTQTPCPVHVESLIYPRLGQFARLQGRVTVSVAVLADGKVESAKATTGHPILREEAEENAKKWIFLPGEPRAVVLVYDFRLEEPALRNPATRTAFDFP